MSQAAKFKTIERNFDLNQEKINLGRNVESLNTQVDELKRLQRKHEAEIDRLKVKH